MSTTTAVGKALVAAGVKVPLNKRVWLWIKDHPKSSSKDVSDAIGAANAYVAVSAGDLLARGMLTVVHEPRRVFGAQFKGGSAMRKVLQYSTPPHMREYELLPVPKKGAKKPKYFVDNAPTFVATAPIPAAVQQASAASKDLQHRAQMDNFIEGLTLRDLRELYSMLDKMFGGKR